MSANFDSILNAGVDLLEALSGDTFTHAGRAYVGNFRTGNSLEQAEGSAFGSRDGGSFTSHGGMNRIVLVLYVARSQFTAPPLAWKNQKIQRATPTPAEYTVSSVNADDPNIYAFVLIGRA